MYADLDPQAIPLIQRCTPFSMASPERLYNVYQSVNYVLDAGIPGAFVECGVWRGGATMMMLETLRLRGVQDRYVFLYDTFDGMSPPTERDVDFQGQDAAGLLSATPKDGGVNVWCDAPIDQVRANIGRVGYPLDRVKLVPGKVEDTLPQLAPPEIALLRLDTDWYESTRHELVELYPRLADRGVLIIDDYGHWKGCRQAVDEYFADRPILLSRVDYTGRCGIKTGPTTA